LTSTDSYRNQTTREPFFWAVAIDVMLLVVLRMKACQECRMELFEGLCALTLVTQVCGLSSTKLCKN
jgi:hypothetical protein